MAFPIGLRNPGNDFSDTSYISQVQLTVEVNEATIVFKHAIHC